MIVLDRRAKPYVGAVEVPNEGRSGVDAEAEWTHTTANQVRMQCKVGWGEGGARCGMQHGVGVKGVLCNAAQCGVGN
jgi:hypothetical protein